MRTKSRVVTINDRRRVMEFYYYKNERRKKIKRDDG